MNELKNKSTILIIVALLVVCGGSFLGVRSVNKGIETNNTTPVVSYTPDSTETTIPWEATTMQPVIDINTTAADLITTFPMYNEAVTDYTTTAALTTIATTIAPTTTTATTTQTTAPALTLPTTSNTTSTTATTAAPATTVSGSTGTTENNALFENGLAGYKFNSEGNFYFTADDPWQRNFGYTEAFDTAAPFVSIYMDTMRVKFRYKNKDWMVQFWKGQYGLAFIGSEIGVYTKPLDRTIDHYDAASNEDALYMACTCYRDGDVIFSREYAKYWWCTGFVPGQLKSFSDRTELAVKCRITMKDEEMLNAFISSLKAAPNNLVEGRHYAVEGLDVFITWQ